MMFRTSKIRTSPLVAPESMLNGRPKIIRLSKSAFRKHRFGGRDAAAAFAAASTGHGLPWLARFRNRWLPNINKNVLLPALISLRSVGLRIIDSNDHVILSTCSTVWAIVSVAFQSVNVCMTIMGVVSNNFHGYLLDQVSLVLATLCSIICSVLLAFSPGRLNALIEKVEDTLFELHCPRDLRQYWMPISLLTVVGWLYMALRFVAVTWVLDNQPPRDVFKGVFFTEASRKYSENTLLFLVALIWYLNTLFVYGTLVFVPILFISFCMILARAFRVHNAVIRDVHRSGRSVEADTLAQIRIFYERICTLVTDLNEIFGPVIFSWYIMIVLSVCIDMTQLFSDTNLLKNTKEDEGFLFSLRGIYSLLSFLGTCLAASRVSEEALAPLPHLHELTLRSWRLDMNTKMEAHFFLSRLSSSPVSMTGWNFFTINRGFILSVCAALTTYVVIIIQMNPKAMKTINKLVTTALNNTGNGTASSE
ncbi:uncharacterized protein [Dermacentor andersoni]|uniref:uncharacterized protein n=1 Tax=Dermacentor andersoni TaxID=34620 RepID=UPI002155EAA5|nr:uncharacterized protein LOC126542378 [Dermacentor andersoni]